MFCVGKFFPPTVKVRISLTYKLQELAELKREVDTRTRMPVDTYFVDSTALIAPFMIKGEHSFFKNLQFLGRSGIKMICGLRVAFVSGLDSDLLGSEVRACDPTKSYVGNYFVQSDIDKVIDDYDKLVTQSGKPGVDILMTCQWPLNITGHLTDPNVSAESAK
jgi:hypothetical protein